MVKKLLSRLTNQIEWKSLLRGFLIFVGLLSVSLWDFSFFPVLLFLILAFFLYISEPPERKTVWHSYIVLILSSLFVLAHVPPVFRIWGMVSFLYGIVFFGLFSFINFRFKNRSAAHGGIVMLALFSFFLALFGLSAVSAYNPWSLFLILLAFFGMYALLRESLAFSGKFTERKRAVIAGTVGFLGLEALWIFQFLPLGAINGSAFLSIILLLLRDVVVANEEGMLNISFVLREVTIFAIAVLAFFAVSPWNL